MKQVQRQPVGREDRLLKEHQSEAGLEIALPQQFWTEAKLDHSLSIIYIFYNLAWNITSSFTIWIFLGFCLHGM